jgi:hypothetical protein
MLARYQFHTSLGVQSSTETYTKINTAMKMETNLAQVSQSIWWNLRTLAQAATTMAAISNHQTVHAAWVDKSIEAYRDTQDTRAAT